MSTPLNFLIKHPHLILPSDRGPHLPQIHGGHGREVDEGTLGAEEGGHTHGPSSPLRPGTDRNRRREPEGVLGGEAGSLTTLPRKTVLPHIRVQVNPTTLAPKFWMAK